MPKKRNTLLAGLVAPLAGLVTPQPPRAQKDAAAFRAETDAKRPMDYNAMPAPSLAQSAVVMPDQFMTMLTNGGASANGVISEYSWPNNQASVFDSSISLSTPDGSPRYYAAQLTRTYDWFCGFIGITATPGAVGIQFLLGGVAQTGFIPINAYSTLVRNGAVSFGATPSFKLRVKFDAFTIAIRGASGGIASAALYACAGLGNCDALPQLAPVPALNPSFAAESASDQNGPVGYGTVFVTTQLSTDANFALAANVITANVAGLYELGVNVMYNCGANAGFFAYRINGAAEKVLFSAPINVTADHVFARAYIRLEAGDTIDFRLKTIGFNILGATFPNSTKFSLRKTGE